MRFALLWVLLVLVLLCCGCGGYHGEIRVGSDPTAVEGPDDVPP